MRKVFAGALALVLCCPIWLAADSQKKEPAGKHADKVSAELVQKMQAQLKQQQEQIEKLRALLEQSRQLLEQAQQKVQEGSQQVQQQAHVAQQQAEEAQQKANSLSVQLTGTGSAGGDAGEKPQAK